MTMQQKMNYMTFIGASLRNKPGRNLATVFCFAFIAANIFTAQFLIAGAAGGVDRSVTRMGADHMVVPSQYMSFLRGAGPDNTIAIVMAEPSDYRIKADIMDKLRKIPGISAMSPQLFVATLDLPELSPVPVNIYGIDPETDFTIRPWLQKPLDKPLGSGEVIVGSAVAGDPGTPISIGDRTYVIDGRLDPTRSSADHAVILRLDDAYTLAAIKGIVPASAPKIIAGDVNAVLIQDTPDEKQDIVGTRIKRVFSSSSEYQYFSVIGRHFSLDPVSEDIRALPGLLNLISAFVVIVSLPLIALIAAMVAHERQREIGLLKSMGAKRNVIFFLIIVESLVLAAVGGITGIFLSFITLFLMNNQGALSSALQVSFRMPSYVEIGSMACLALLGVIIVGSISALWPAYRSSTTNPYDIIRYECH
jgi:putative ABC transport system permease protein